MDKAKIAQNAFMGHLWGLNLSTTYQHPMFTKILQKFTKIFDRILLYFGYEIKKQKQIY